jgi:hypothetical protein
VITCPGCGAVRPRHIAHQQCPQFEEEALGAPKELSVAMQMDARKPMR